MRPGILLSLLVLVTTIGCARPDPITDELLAKAETIRKQLMVDTRAELEALQAQGVDPGEVVDMAFSCRAPDAGRARAVKRAISKLGYEVEVEGLSVTGRVRGIIQEPVTLEFTLRPLVQIGLLYRCEMESWTPVS